MTDQQSATESSNNLVNQWFGADFARLHPLLQRLHLQGGALEGDVELTYGRGLAGLIGRRLGRRLGLPSEPGRVALRVEIGHDAQGLHWNRVFAGSQRMNSLFTPHGRYPDGHWSETSGPVTLQLGVAITEGGWFWQPRAMRLHGMPLPLWLLPRSHAYKRIVSGPTGERYQFSVSFNLPLLGQLLGYAGELEMSAS